MGQHDYDLADATGAAFRADANLLFQAIASMNSGASAPTTTFANMGWFDTANNLMKIRKEDDSGWITIAEKTATEWKPYWKTALLDDAFQAKDATLASLAAVDGVTGDILYASGADAWARLAKDTDGMFLKQVSGIPAWGDVLKRGTPIATTSGTTHDFTIAAGANLITIPLYEISTDGAGELLIRLGDAGGIESASYNSLVSEASNSDADTTGFILALNQAAGSAYSGIITLARINGNKWGMSGNTTSGSGAGTGLRISAGKKTLSAELTTVQLTTTAGDTFDGGEANVFVQ